jgi:uncharacterized protein involved in exopolysaccharide biosynthesis
MAAPGAPSVDLGELAALLRAYRRSIAAVVIVPLVVTAIVLEIIPARYTATTSLLLDSRGGAPVTTGELAAGRLSQDVNLIESEVRLVSSVPVLRRVVRSAKLVDDPEFNTKVPTGATPAEAEDAVMAVLTDHLTVRRPERTIILDVDLWSRDKAKAARLADAIADAFIDEQLVAKAKASTSERDRIAARMRDLDAQIADEQRKVDAFRAEHHLFDAPSGSLDSQTLVASSSALDKSQAEAVEARERLATVRRLMAGPAGSLAALPDAIRSQTITSLRTQYAEAQRHYDILSATLGPQHPALKEARKELDGVQGLITAELRRIADGLAQSLAVAQGSEHEFALRLRGKEQLSAELDQDRATLGVMVRGVDADRATYARLRDADALLVQEGSTVPIARQLAPAVLPLRPSFPHKLPTLLIVGAFAVALAIVQALLRGRGLPRLAPGPVAPIPVTPRPQSGRAGALQKKRRLYAVRQLR